MTFPEGPMTARERYDLAVKAHQRDQLRSEYNAADSGKWYRKLSAMLRDVEAERLAEPHAERWLIQYRVERDMELARREGDHRPQPAPDDPD